MIRCVLNESGDGREAARFSEKYGLRKTEQVRNWHRTFPEYRETPLENLKHLARYLGVSAFYVKDESFRFGLNAFKALGGSYAIGRVLAGRLRKDLSDLPFSLLTEAETRNRLGDLTFITATDGNHGRGVAWTANRLSQKSVVYMPRGTAPERLENILALGSDAMITDLVYDDAVRLAASRAEERGWILIQDTSWDGYETIPGWIMEGYTTIGAEILDQLSALSEAPPTHIFLQAGVGSMAGAMAAFFKNAFPENPPKIIIVEPESADCLFLTAEAADGRLHAASDMHTIMAGLACGEPCGLAWEILNHCADAFLSIPDETAAFGMRMLGNPLPGDGRIVSGESGASGAGTAAELLRNKENQALRRDLGFTEDSRILCISTEGDTDRENYRRIVWDGAFGREGE